jgi:hypothetical protein
MTAIRCRTFDTKSICDTSMKSTGPRYPPLARRFGMHSSYRERAEFLVEPRVDHRQRFRAQVWNVQVAVQHFAERVAIGEG